MYLFMIIYYITENMFICVSYSVSKIVWLFTSCFVSKERHFHLAMRNAFIVLLQLTLSLRHAVGTLISFHSSFIHTSLLTSLSRGGQAVQMLRLWRVTFPNCLALLRWRLRLVLMQVYSKCFFFFPFILFDLSSEKKKSSGNNTALVVHNPSLLPASFPFCMCFSHTHSLILLHRCYLIFTYSGPHCHCHYLQDFLWSCSTLFAPVEL